MANTINERTTHDLWIESRQFQLTLDRTSNTTLKITVEMPNPLDFVDGAVILLSSKPIGPNNYPDDGTQYEASLAFDSVTASKIFDAQVVAFYSDFFQTPFPVTTLSANKASQSFSIDVTNTDPTTIYYASIHPCTSILQYYPIGIQSYPLESSAQLEKSVSAYTGNIPSLPIPPTNPTDGFVYFDTQLNLIMFYDATSQSWIQTRGDAIMSGEVNPGTMGQTYLQAGTSNLYTFDGRTWGIANATNFQVRDSSNNFVPFVSMQSGITVPAAPVTGDFFFDFTTRRLNYFNGMEWTVPSTTNTLFFGTAGYLPAFSVPFSFEYSQLITPYNGLLFYNTKSKALNVFMRGAWTKVNTEYAGSPTTDKIGIGNDGSYAERTRLIKILKAQLGWPGACVELSEEQFNVAIDNALDTYRQLCAGAYEKRHFIFPLLKDQQIYYLNSPIDKTDKVVSVTNISRLNILGSNSMNWDSNLYFQTFINQYFNGATIDLLSLHLTYNLSEEFNRVLAGDLMFTWNEARRELTILRRIAQNEKVVLEVILERTEQELLSDRWAKQFFQNWALAECKNYLGQIRGKFTSGTPGPNGSISLNGSELITESEADFTALKEALLNYEFGGLGEMGNVSVFLM